MPAAAARVAAAACRGRRRAAAPLPPLNITPHPSPLPAVAENLLSKEDLVSMDRGCVCCSLRNDIVKALRELQGRAAGRGSNYDAILLETTGALALATPHCRHRGRPAGRPAWAACCDAARAGAARRPRRRGRRRMPAAAHPPPVSCPLPAGLADPAPVAFTFFANSWISANYRLDSILCLVDAQHLRRVRA